MCKKLIIFARKITFLYVWAKGNTMASRVERQKWQFAEDIKKKPKLFWLDIGLVNFATGAQSEIIGKTDISDAWRGTVAEHIVGQELYAISPAFLEQRHFWVREEKSSQAEVDFYIKADMVLFP